MKAINIELLCVVVESSERLFTNVKFIKCYGGTNNE